MSTDLSQFHHAINAWPEHPEPALTDEQVAQYWEQGFLIGIPVLSEKEVDAIHRDLDEISDPAHQGHEFWYEYHSEFSKTGGMLHGTGGWRVRDSLHDLIWHPKLTSAFRQLLGGPGRFLHDQLFFKPPRQSGSVSWHQDYSYWTYTQPMNHVTCWIALDDADLSNGCVQYVPGSHKWGVLPRPSSFTQHQNSLVDKLTEQQKEAFKPVPAEVKKGSVLFHHPLTIHGSLPNTSDRPRRGTTIHVMADGTRAMVEEPTVDGVPAWLVGGGGPFYPLVDEPAGPVLDGQFFPLL
ncbi:phytanoyl-CoA dioxygenase family protein [Streptomyces sp. NPDC090029]|uniref:phytanoyl-CoA dioxygenase family protein n=1 Tax=Streptomyces sp. NPDC090029 TaxID=3365924 RepID=UPI00381195BB